MNRILLLLFLCPIAYATAQNSVGIGTDSPNNNAVLELVSQGNNQGFLVPRLSTTQRTATSFTAALSAGDNGLLVYDSDENEFYYWSSTQWEKLRVTAATITDFGGQPITNIADPVNNTDAATKSYVDNLSIDDADADPSNEIQDLELVGNSLSITNNSSATIIDLSTYSGTNTDNQTLSLSGTDLSITGGNTLDMSVLQDGFEANTDNQTLARSATALSISGGNTVPVYWRYLAAVGDPIEPNYQPERIDAGYIVQAPQFITESSRPVQMYNDRISFDGKVIIVGGNYGQAVYYGQNSSQNVVIKGNSANRDHGEVAIYDAANGLQARMYVNSSGQGVVTADSKSFHMQHPENPDMQIWYASLEGPEAAAYARGQIRLEGGEAVVEYEDHFQQVANMDGLTINLTPHSAESKGLAAIERTSSGFKIKELFEGSGSYLVDWEAKSVRKGFEDFKVLRYKDDPDYLK